eukprot:TRINITY_DN7496_c0_g1_i3.p2 TRINITY_DN7496_c0_g1~~TRINITY_DN7496_c0_g1_i3.p2  ORF type:complete len:118 (-),score=10.55 TRINITY_DN7496_c0_g1_i3:788-1141(-)
MRMEDISKNALSELEAYRDLDQIGDATFTVSTAENNKVVMRQFSSTSHHLISESEIARLRQIKHTNILPPLDVVRSNLAETLADYVLRVNGLSEAEVLLITRQIVSACLELSKKLSN